MAEKTKKVEESPLTKEELEELQKWVGNAPVLEEKHGIFQFLNKVLTTEDTSKVANLDKEELNSIRIRLDGSNYFEAFGMDVIAKYLKRKAEVTLATSDSKGGFLVQAAITTKKDVKLGEAKKKKTKWFEKNVEQTGGSS